MNLFAVGRNGFGNRHRHNQPVLWTAARGARFRETSDVFWHVALAATERHPLHLSRSPMMPVPSHLTGFVIAFPTMTEPPLDRFWPIARDKSGLLTAMMRELAGDAHISFEGNLSRCVFPPDLQPTGEETPCLRRQTISPRQEFVVVALAPESVRPILNVILPDNRYLKDIIHIQIEKNGKLQFGSYDQFHHECIVGFSPGVTPDLLNRLQSSGVIRSFRVYAA